TWEPPPLARARQIRPGGPLGAKTGPGRHRSQDKPNGVGRLAGQAGTYAWTLRPHHRKPRRQGRRTHAPDTTTKAAGTAATPTPTAGGAGRPRRGPPPRRKSGDVSPAARGTAEMASAAAASRTITSPASEDS